LFSFCVLIVLAVNTMFVSTQLAPAIYSFIALVALARLGFIERLDDTAASESLRLNQPYEP
jgi:predicted membrane protein